MSKAYGPAQPLSEPRLQFDQAVIALAEDLRRYLRRRVHDQETAEDLAQETLASMLVYRDRPDIQCYASLMFRIAHNVLLGHRRMRRRRHAASHVSLEDAGPLSADISSVETIVDARRALDQLFSNTLSALPPRCAQAFTLNRFGGLSYPEVACEMGISLKTVEKHITRALIACRSSIDRHAMR